MDENNCKITIIINTDNSEKTICDTLESIKDADEIIILDNHSKDDTIEFAKEYRAKVIYALKNEMQIGFNQALDEALGEWILFLEDDEIIPQKLMSDILRYIENPKKKKNCVSFYHKTFYLDKEIKALRKKKTVRLFKKGFAQFDDNFTIKPKSRIYQLNKSFDTQKSILKFSKKDISSKIAEILDKTRNELKNKTFKRKSLSKAVISKFLYWFFVKKACFEGERGFIFAFLKSFEEFIIKTTRFEAENKQEK